MSSIFSTMYDLFQNSKLSGSYFLLFALSIVILYTVNNGKNRQVSIYPMVLTAIVVGNPLTLWLLSLIFPVVGNYEQIVMLLPMLIYIPFGACELISSLKSHKERVLVGILLFFFISVCGNLFGVFGGNTKTSENFYSEEKKQIIAEANRVAKEDGLVLADDEILPFLTSYGENIPLLYGQDMMMFNADLGIMDMYDDGIIQIHNMMWTPEENFDYIAYMAEIYGCDIIIIRRFDDAKVFTGNYKVIKNTDNYLVYGKK